jgi:DNA (cytosine-5)-methyltransferase 1
MTAVLSKRRSSAVTVTDQFCGAGGSSIGATAAGAELRLAMNHWQLAIDTHNSNFPSADHACADISTTDPRRFRSTDILITSPECTNHTAAKGKRLQTRQGELWGPPVDEAAERRRATMWDVPRFAEYHQYEIVVVENVIEARRWLMWDAWLLAMHSLGYDDRAVFLNSMHCRPTPQSRDRMYVVFWKRGNKKPDLDFRPEAWCPSCDAVVSAVQFWKNPAKQWGRYRTQYLFGCRTCNSVVEPFASPAASALDWGLPTVRIGDREKPLADKTLERIRAGMERYWPATIIQGAGHTYEHGTYKRAWTTDRPLPTQMGTILHGVAADPLLVNLDRPGDGAGHVRPTSMPLSTQTTRQVTALITELRGGGSTARPVDDPLATVCASGNHHGLVMRNNTGARRCAPQPRSRCAPCPPPATSR